MLGVGLRREGLLFVNKQNQQLHQFVALGLALRRVFP